MKTLTTEQREAMAHIEAAFDDAPNPAMNLLMADGRLLRHKGTIWNGPGSALAYETFDGLHVLYSLDDTPHGELAHISISRAKKLPTWDDLRFVKDAGTDRRGPGQRGGVEQLGEELRRRSGYTEAGEAIGEAWRPRWSSSAAGGAVELGAATIRPPVLPVGRTQTVKYGGRLADDFHCDSRPPSTWLAQAKKRAPAGEAAEADGLSRAFSKCY